MSFSVGSADDVRSDRLSEEVRRAGDGRGRADVLRAGAIARCEESLAEALEVLFPRPSVARFAAVALCATAVTSAWSLATLPRVALGRLGRSPIRCDPYQPFRWFRVFRAVAREASSLKRLHVLCGRRGGVAMDRHRRDKSTLREFSAGCQSALNGRPTLTLSALQARAEVCDVSRARLGRPRRCILKVGPSGYRRCRTTSLWFTAIPRS